MHFGNFVFACRDQVKISGLLKNLPSSTMETVQQLKTRVAELEAELTALKQSQPRTKIDQMSAEVVDSNPYRYGCYFNYE